MPDEIDRSAASIPDSWSPLRTLTSARIALGRTGASTPTGPMLEFQLAHAAARDAVHAEFEPRKLVMDITKAIPHRREFTNPWVGQSAATDAKTFLLRPDLGRRLSDGDRAMLKTCRWIDFPGMPNPDLAIMISDGLSALAVHRQVPPLLMSLETLLNSGSWRLAPTVIACRGRVAIQDEIGELLGAKIALILIGERPGLGSPDSLGAYMVYGPRVGLTDANRNCVSNIRLEGLPPDQAARTLHYLLTQARQHKLSGVGLKDNSRLLNETITADRLIPP